ncbi:unnamed protein product [Adineta steineri]|uniref:Epg5-like TPR domain-containing protein n=2 Tax=Adineta steineri TaxID=433720 RepID=A0A813ZFU1_9BILA|nr:unnamed protein product [Adineta steineri]CAF0917199.1 unnamed protein product [Adineta steineri]
MAELERPRIRSEKKQVKERTTDDEESQLENRLRDLKEFFEERKNETIDDTNVNTEEISNDNEEDSNVQTEQISEEPIVNSEINTNEHHVDTNISDNVNELPIESNQMMVTEETNTPSIAINDNEITETITPIESTEEQHEITTTNHTIEEVSPTTITNYENSSFIYPHLSLSLWSPATAPLSSFDIEMNGTQNDPYSFANFNPSLLQLELRQTYLPFINITDDYFLSEHEKFITDNPRYRSSITKEDTDITHTNEDDDEFYFLISSFYDIRTKIDHLTNEYDVLQRKIASLLPHVWSFSCEKIESGSYCGDNVYLKRSILYEQANFDRNLAKEIEDTLKQLRTIIYQQYVALKYETLWYKMKIDTYINNLLLANKTTKKLLHTIEVLFNFQRYRTRDTLFYTYTRQLLKQTIDIVYKYGNYNETLFIINHVLRCPPGIHQWATNFVRFLLPTSFDILCSPMYIRYVAHFLATLLFPIKNRDIFLQNWLGENGETIPQISTLNTVKNQQQWMLIDADGQERAALLRWDTLNEDDLIAILNQFNLNYLMNVLFSLNEQINQKQQNVSYENTLRILAILDLFVEILCRGFDTYADSQYKNFHKHIGKMIRDCVHVCRYHVDGVLQHLDNDDKIRLRDHYFAYIYRSVENIIRQCRNVRWSLLSLFALFDLPQSLQYRLLHLICSIPDDEPVTVETSAAVDQMLNSSTPSEVLSLLKVLHNLGQTGDESGQISNVIFYITCLHPISREYSLRDGRSILAHFASLRPTIISHLLKLSSIHIDAVGKVLFGLFRSLPMEIWMPSDNDLSIIEKWLDDISQVSIGFQLALHMIDTMNWQDLPDKQQLCIPYTIHCEVALILLKLHLKYCDKLSASKEDQLQLQNFTKNTQINLDQWIWTAILRLQLNQSCLSIDSFIGSMNQEHVAIVNQNQSHLSTDNGMSDEAINDIRRAIEQYHNPVAYYISFGLDQPGVSAAGFFEKGIEYLFQLVQNSKYTGAIRVLHDMSGILVRSVDYLIEHVQFMTTLKTLLNASDTSMSLLKTASSYLIQQKTYDETTNAKLLTAAILDLLIWLEDNPKSRRLVLLLWFKLLTALKDWNKDSSILYVLDNLLAHSFVHDVMNKEVTDHLFELAVSALNPRQTQPVARSGVLSWLPLPSSVTSTQTYWSSLSIDSSLLSRYPIVSYYFLNAENSFEIDQNVLVELKAELELNPTSKVDQIWKKLIQQRHYPFIPLTSLSIYRWGTMACEMPVTHSLLPLVWEKFFTIYLSKHENCLHRVGYRLFESPVQTTFLKQMKRSLCQASEYYSSSNLPYANQLSTFYHSLSLWIDEPRLHDPQLNILSLPQQYDNERLAHLFNADYRIFDIKWLELVDLRQMYETLIKFTNELWLRKRINHENNQSVNTNQHRSIMTSSQKLVDLVSNVQRPSIHSKMPVSNPEQISVSNQQILPNDPNEIKNLFETELMKIINWLQTHCKRHEKQIDLDQTLMSLLPLLWKNEFQEQSIQASCQNVLNPVHQCTRPAYIIVRYKSKQQCQNSNQRLETILNEHKQLLTDACRSCDIDMCRSIDLLIQIVQYFTRQLSSPFSNENQSLIIIDIGTQLFYSLLLVYDDKYNEYMQPLSEQLSSLFDTLGEIFVKSNLRQPQIILEYIVLNRPNISRLIPYFNPNSLIQSEKFIDIYKKLSKMFTFVECPSYLLQMFRKFNVKQWFENASNSNQRLLFIDTLFNHFRSLVDNFTLAARRETPPGYDELPLIEQTNQLFEISIGHMIQILNYSYPSQIGYLFRNLIESIQIMRKKQKTIQQQNNSLIPSEFQQSIERGLLPTKVLSEFLDQLHYLENTSTITLGRQQIDEMINWLQTFVLKQIDEQSDKRLVQLYQSWRPCLNELTRIYSIMLILNIQKRRIHHDYNISQIFEQILLLYGPFIDQTYSLFSLTEWKTIIDHHGDMLTRMIKTFLQLYEELYEYINESYQYQQEFFNCIFQYWYKIVKHLITNEYTHPILDIYHRYLPHLSWTNYHLTIECLLIFDELINANNLENIPSTSLYEFIIYILSTIDIHTWMIEKDEKLTTALVPTYFCLLINIYLSPQAKYAQNNDHLSRLASQCELINWSYLESDTYQNIINSIMSKVEHDFILAPRASIDGYLNRILRCSCEFNSSSVATDRVRTKRLAYLRLIEQCLINAKNQHNQDEYRLILINLLNDIESLTIQGKVSLNDELEDIFIELIRFLNISSLGQTILNSYQNYFLDWIRQSQNSITMLPLFVSVCRTLKDRHRKILFIEIILYIYFMHDQKSNWSIVFNFFEQNEQLLNIKTDDYIQLCCEYNAFLSLYLFSEYELNHNKQQLNNNDILNNEFKYVEKLIELLTNGKLRIIHGEEERVLLLMIKINQIIIHQLQYGRSTDVLLTRLIRNYAHWLLALGTDNKEYAYAGIFAIIGIGKKAQYSLRFRLFVKLLGVMQLEQLTDEPYKIRIDSNDRCPDPLSANNLVLKQTLSNLSLAATTTNEYSDFKSELIHCNSEYLQRSDVTFFDVSRLIHYLCTHLFADLPYLTNVSTHDS